MKTLKKNNDIVLHIFFYIIKLWIFTSIISSFLYTLSNEIVLGRAINMYETIFNNVFWEFYFWILLFSLSYSLPALLILGFIIKMWTNNKLVLALISIILVFGTFYITGLMNLRSFNPFILYPPIIYSIVISILIWAIPLKRKTK